MFVVCTPTILGSMESSPSDLSAKISFKRVHLSVLELGLNRITQWLMSDHVMLFNRNSRTDAHTHLEPSIANRFDGEEFIDPKVAGVQTNNHSNRSYATIQLLYMRVH